jgi:Ala-tRNA(Pro) deacylase
MLEPPPPYRRSPEEVLALLRARGALHAVHSHPPLHTVEDARRLRGDLEGAFVKNLFLRDRSGDLLLLVCLSERDIDLQALRHLLGYRRLSFASPEQLWEHLGVRPGSVSPLALINATPGALTLFADEALRASPLNNLHPLTNELTAQVSPEGWVSLAREWGFEPRWVNLDR